jgi:hypothetical protein
MECSALALRIPAHQRQGGIARRDDGGLVAGVITSGFEFQTAKLPCSRGAERPRFAISLTTCARGWSGGRRQGCCVRHPLEAGLTYPPRTARHRARPRLGAAPPSAPPTTGLSTVPGPRSGQLSLRPPQGSLLESAPRWYRTRNIYSKLGIPSIGIFRFRKNILPYPDSARRSPERISLRNWNPGFRLRSIQAKPRASSATEFRGPHFAGQMWDERSALLLAVF